MADTIPSGTLSYAGTLTASTAETISIQDRWNYAAVTNGGSTVLYATADGSTASATNGVVIPPGTSTIIANQLPYWNQSRRVIPQGVISVGNGSAYSAATNPSSASNPGTVTPMAALDGVSATNPIPDPAASISLYTTGTGVSFSVNLAG